RVERDDMAALHLVQPGRIARLDIMGAAVRTVDDQMQPVAHLVAGQPLVEHAADDGLGDLAAVPNVLGRATLVGQPMIGQRPVHAFDDAALFAKPPHPRLAAVPDLPLAGFDLAGEAVAFKRADTSDQRCPIVAHQIAPALTGAKVDDALIALFGNQHPVEPGPALGPHLVGEFAAQFDLCLRAKFERHQFLRPVPDAVGDVVPADVEDTPVIEDTPDDDMGVGMAGVVMIDGDPVEVRPKIGFHLPHQIAGEAAKVAHLGAVFRRDDEAELMTVVAPTLDERLSVRVVLDGRIAAAFVAVARDAIAFEIAQMSIDRARAGSAAHLRATSAGSLSGQLHHPRLHHDAARPEAATGIPLP